MKTANLPLTNIEVGRRIGVDHSTASLYRRGLRMPSMPVLMSIFDAFEVPSAEQEKLTRSLNKKSDRKSQLKVFGTWMEKYIYRQPSIDV